MPETTYVPVAPVAVPLAPQAAPPSSLPADVHALLGGHLTLNAGVWAHLTEWLLGAGLAIALVIALTGVAVKAWDYTIAQLFRLINANMGLQAHGDARVALRTSTLSRILASLGRAVIYFLGLMIVLSKLDINIAPILASAGILGLAVGFGAQSLVKDVISGFFILIEDQFGVGDIVELSGRAGLVEHMNLRITQLRDSAGLLITVPNGSIVLVVNYSKEWARAVIEVPIGYDDDVERAIAAVVAAAEVVQQTLADKVLEPVEVLGVEAFRESDYLLKASIKTRPLEQWAVLRAWRKQVLISFNHQEIAFPHPKRHLHLTPADLEALASRASAPLPGQTPA